LAKDNLPILLALLSVLSIATNNIFVSYLTLCNDSLRHEPDAPYSL